MVQGKPVAGRRRRKNIVVTGNPVIDALSFVAQQEEPPDITELLDRLGTSGPGTRQLILVTAHRRENFGQPFENLCLAIRELAHARMWK